MDDEWEDIPPMPSLVIVGAGTSAGGEQWNVQAGGTRSSCWTLMYITLPDGRQLGGGGMGGEVLPAGRMMNCSVHQSDDEVRYMVGRVHPAIRRLRLTFAGAPPSLIDLEPFGESPDLGVAFVAAILDDDSSLADITA